MSKKVKVADIHDKLLPALIKEFAMHDYKVIDDKLLVFSKAVNDIYKLATININGWQGGPYITVHIGINEPLVGGEFINAARLGGLKSNTIKLLGMSLIDEQHIGKDRQLLTWDVDIETDYNKLAPNIVLAVLNATSTLLSNCNSLGEVYAQLLNYQNERFLVLYDNEQIQLLLGIITNKVRTGNY